MREPPQLTPEQLSIHQIVDRIKQTRFMFWFLIGSFSVVTIALLVSIFWSPCDETGWPGWHVRVLLGLLDGVIGISFRTVVNSLYPASGK